TSRSAARRATCRPTSTLPVNEILSTPASTRASPVAPSPVATRNRSAGSPASAASSASRSAVNGENSDGFNTTAFPAASAASVARMVFSTGRFHGPITPTTPYGSRTRYARLVTSHPLWMHRRASTLCARRAHHLEAQLPGLAAAQVGQLLRVRREHAPVRIEHPRPAPHAQRAPRRLRRACTLHQRAHRRRIEGRDPTQRLSRRRRDDRQLV